MSLKELEVVVAKLEGTRDPQGRGQGREGADDEAEEGDDGLEHGEGRLSWRGSEIARGWGGTSSWGSGIWWV